jgi:exosortase A
MQLKPPPEITLGAALARLDAASIVLIALAFLAPFAFYFATAKSIVDIWNSSETFAHGYIILPISLCLIWRRRANFSLLPPTPWWPALGLLALAGFGWLVARLGEVQVVQQYAFVAMLPLTALAIFGRRLAGSLAFPLLFTLAAVPFGEVFIGPLISFTADFTVWALQMTGIPVLRNGTHFEIPTGSWSVVVACSGVRYLISSVTLGCLYAYLTYRSTARRALFIVTAIIVPIIANGLRAYMIVMIGHLSSMKLAVGVDHIIYGWLFFGLVMFIMFWIGSFWREDEEPAPRAVAAQDLAGHAVPRAGAAAFLPMTLALVALAALWPAFATYNHRVTFNPKPVQLAPVAVIWNAAPTFSAWTPDYMAPDAAFNGVYRAPAGAATEPVALTILYYRNQQKNKSLISSVNVLTVEHNPVASQTGTTLRVEQMGGRPFTLRESRLKGATGALLVWQWVWIDERMTANNYVGKLWQAEAALRFRPDDGAAVMLTAPFSENPEEARRSLRAFLDAHAAPIEAALAATRSR